MRLVFLLALATAMALPAQEAVKPVEPVKWQTGERYIQRVYQVQHTDIDELFRLVRTTPANGQTPVLSYSSALKAISAYGTVSEVESIIANLKAIDVPRPQLAAGPKGFELTMYILVAGNQTDVPGSPVPDLLSSVTKQLSAAFGLTQFKLMEASIVRGMAGNRQGWGGTAGAFGAYEASVQRANIERVGADTTVVLNNYSFELRAPKGRTTFATNLSLREGQQVVVGKANVDDTEKSLILVLSVKVDK